MTHWLPLDWVLVVVTAWLLVGVIGVFALRRLRFVARVLFPAGGMVALVLFGVALAAMFDGPEVAVLPIGLPTLPFHLRLDSLSAFFLMVIGATAAGVSAFAAGYFRRGEGTPPGLLCLEYHLFLASMVGVVLADDAYMFMVMWETMALSSFFLVTANHRIPEIRRAGYLYLLVAHVGAIGILMCYGLLRVTFDLIATPLWWWGAVLLALGLATALFGVVFAAVQVDMKRLLAYSSIENIGLLLAGIGLAVVFSAYDMKPMAALALTATLYHVASHALFKSLLFLSIGSVLHATGERNLGKLGGLIRTMPWVAWVTLVGTLASAGLPPLGGFVSEWLLLQSFLFTPGLPHPVLNMLIPVVAALIALVAALAGYTMVKFFGVIFLGQPREARLAKSHDAVAWERAGLVWLAVGCVALGLFPGQVIALIDPVTRSLVGDGIGPQVAAHGWLILAPVAPERASYSPLLFLLLMSTSFALAFVLVRRLYHGRVRRAPPWDCGYPLQTARMQDTAEGFGQPIRQVFEPFFRIERHLPTPFDKQPYYHLAAGDHFWHWLYLPVARLTEATSRLVGMLQQGRISTYLMYSFVTLLVMLVLVFR